MIEFLQEDTESVAHTARRPEGRCEGRDGGHVGNRPVTHAPARVSAIHGVRPNPARHVRTAHRGAEVLPLRNDQRQARGGCWYPVPSTEPATSHRGRYRRHRPQRVRRQATVQQRHSVVCPHQRPELGRAHFDTKRDRFPLRAGVFLYLFNLEFLTEYGVQILLQTILRTLVTTGKENSSSCPAKC